MVFGAALMHDKTIDSFVWLFKIYLQMMSGKAPKPIFVDQGAAMAKAILQVVPSIYHKFCTWHIMQNALKHVNSIFTCLGGVKNFLSMFVDSIKEKNKILTTWTNMLDVYDVHDNDWLKRICELREKWA